MPNDEIRRALEKLANVLDMHGESDAAGQVRGPLAMGGDHLVQFLISDSLWGGAGSIADQAGVTLDRNAGRQAIEVALAELGEAQIRAGIVNPRTKSCVAAFRRWEREGL